MLSRRVAKPPTRRDYAPHAGRAILQMNPAKHFRSGPRHRTGLLIGAGACFIPGDDKHSFQRVLAKDIGKLARLTGFDLVRITRLEDFRAESCG